MKTLVLLLLPLTAFAQGLRGAYFQGRSTCPSLPADIKVARLDPAIDFFANGTMGSNFNTVDAGVPVNNFTARWSGTSRSGAWKRRRGRTRCGPARGSLGLDGPGGFVLASTSRRKSGRRVAVS
jgi:hypothetical protein